MQEKHRTACELALKVADVLKGQPREVSIDAIDIARILFRPPVSRDPDREASANPVHLESSLQAP